MQCEPKRIKISSSLTTEPAHCEDVEVEIRCKLDEKGGRRKGKKRGTQVYIAYESSSLSLSGVSTHSGSDRREGQMKPLK
jgi:hypothetical protein